MRKASVDYGTKRSGIAITDPTATLVTSSKTVPPKEVIKELEKIESLGEIVVGLPLNLKNKFTLSTRKAVDMAIEIAKSFMSLPVYMVDERFTSTIANREIVSSNSSKDVVDELSASILLEDYLRGNIRRYRVSTSLPTYSEEISAFIESLNPSQVVLISDAFRGIESAISLPCDIYEDDPVYFRLREIDISQKKLRSSLHFGVFWDIILSTTEAGDLIVCDSRHIKNCPMEKFKSGVYFMIENESGSMKIGGRSLNFFKVKSL